MSLPSNIGSVGLRWYEQLEPLTFDEETLDYPLLRQLGAWGTMVQPVFDLVSEDEEGRPGWSSLFDVDRCPPGQLPWLGQLRGVRLTQGISVEAQRDEIRDPAPDKRGTPTALIAAVQPYLTGTKHVNLVELVDGNYNKALLVTKTSETPAVSERINRVPNPRAAVNLDTWENYGLAAMARFELPAGGVPALDDPAADTAIGCAGDGGGDSAYLALDLESGVAYSFSAYVYLDSSTATGLQLRVYDSGGQVANSSTFSTLDTWTRINVSHTPDETGSHDVEIAQIGAGATAYYITAAQVEAGSLAGYFDGSSDNSYWLGAPHASQSKEIVPDPAVLAAATTQKRVGLLLTHVASEEALIDELLGDVDDLVGTVDDL